MSVDAKLVMQLRERTSAGMMDCKKALLATNGDLEAAVLEIRKAGLIKAEKKVDRVAAEGAIVVSVSADTREAVILEMNSETDFVARDTHFTHFAETVCQTALTAAVTTVEELKGAQLLGGSDTVDVARQHLVVKIGENIQIRRLARLTTTGVIGAYLHGNKIGVLVALSGGTVQTAKDIAMHIAASRPVVVKPTEVSQDLVTKERMIYEAQAKESGKPAAIAEKMIEGRIQKFLNEVSLLGQPFVKQPDLTVEQFLKEKGVMVEAFVCFEVGEGIEKVQGNFVEEVMAQVRKS